MDTTKTYKDDAMCEGPETYENVAAVAADDDIETYECATYEGEGGGGGSMIQQQLTDDAAADADIETYENATYEGDDGGGGSMIQQQLTFDEFVAKKYQETIEENYRKIIKCIDGTSTEEKRERKELCARIGTFRATKLPEYEKMTVSVDFILEKIKSGDPTICAFFCKDPVKQTFHEKVQMAWIKQRLYFDVEKSTDICLSQGKLIFINKTSSPRPSDATKTFDAFVRSKNMYLILKYTTGAGGAQDNQFADVKNFCKEAVSYIRANEFASETFAFYLDSTYYTAKKIEILQKLIPDDMKARIVLTNCASI
jgi:hypothetical protein